MLDAYIIERIRRERERERRKGSRVPLYIEQTPPPSRPRQRPEGDSDKNDRGSVIIDFQVM